MAENPPYVLSPGMLSNALEKIKHAATPDRFTRDFLSNTLGMKGGSPTAIIPFLKRISFLKTDASPSDLYKKFRNPAESGSAVAEALKTGYKSLFDMNEKAHELTDDDLKGLIVQATGLERDSRTVQAIIGSFKALKKLASFQPKKTDKQQEQTAIQPKDFIPPVENTGTTDSGIEMNLSYTINLNLPATSDIAVFNAIFKSLRENLLKK